MLTILLLAVGLPVLWCFGTGYTAKLLDKETDWYNDTIWPASIFAWPVLLIGIWGFEFQAWLSRRLDERKETKSLPPPPPIQIKPGAKITDWDQYSELMGLCTEFEARNGIDSKCLLEKNK